MKPNTFIVSLLVLLGAFQLEAGESSIVTNPQNVDEVDEDFLKDMLVGKERFWTGGAEVVIAILKNDPESESVLREYSGMTPMKFKNHWHRIAFSGRGKMPKLFSDVEDLVDFVNSNKGAIGIVSADTQLSALRKIN